MTAATPKMTADITLGYPIMVGGVLTDRLTMRVPRLKDRMRIDALRKDDGTITDAEAEVRLFANLMDLAPEDMDELAMTDYDKVQVAYRSFKGTRASKK